MEPTPPGGSTAARAIVAVLILGLGMMGLAMSLCGGYFSGLAVFDFATGNASGDVPMEVLLLVVGGGAFAVGLLLIVLAVVSWRRVVTARRS